MAGYEGAESFWVGSVQIFMEKEWEQCVDLHNKITTIAKQVVVIVRLCMHARSQVWFSAHL